MTDTWFRRGWKDPEMDRVRSRQMDRFWVRPGESGRIVLLDQGEPFNLNLHDIKVGDEYPTYACLTNWEADCPLCDAGDDANYVGHLTVLELWMGREGEQRVSKKLFPMKPRVFKAIATLVEKRGGAPRGWLVEATRADERSSRVGSSFDFERKIDDIPREFAQELTWLNDAKYKSKGITPETYCQAYDYLKVFARPEARELIRAARRMAGTTWRTEEKSGGGKPEEGGPPANDSPPPDDSEIPF